MSPILRRNPPRWREFSGRRQGHFGDVSAKKSPLKGMKTGRGRGDGGVEKGYKKGPQQRIATALSGVIIQQILCASYFRRYHSIAE